MLFSEVLLETPSRFGAGHLRGIAQPLAMFFAALFPTAVILPVAYPGFLVIRDIALLWLNFVLENVPSFSASEICAKGLGGLRSEIDNSFLSLPSD